MKNNFLKHLTNNSNKDLIDLLGRARAKRGMFEGDLEDGELEIGQITGLINKIQPASKIIKEMAAITASMVAELRGKTDAPMMECKKALVENEGNLEKAILKIQMSFS